MEKYIAQINILSTQEAFEELDDHLFEIGGLDLMCFDAYCRAIFKEDLSDNEIAAMSFDEKFELLMHKLELRQAGWKLEVDENYIRVLN